MDPKVKEFIEAARAKERIEFERQRNAHLISLGFVKTEKDLKRVFFLATSPRRK